MPRNFSGVYSKPAGTTPTNGDDADATQFNLLMDDMTQALTDSLPRDGSAPMTGALAMGSNKITGLATGTDAGDAVRYDQVSDLVPAGTIIWYAGTTAPAGYIKANAPTVSRTSYPRLFAALGTAYGAGDGSTTFVAGPDMRGLVPRGLDDGRGIDAGRSLGSYQADAVQNHTHTGASSTSGSHTHSLTSGGNVISTAGAVPGFGGGTSYINNGAATIVAAGDHTHIIDVYGMASGSSAAETRVKNIALLACIKY